MVSFMNNAKLNAWIVAILSYVIFPIVSAIALAWPINNNSFIKSIEKINNPTLGLLTILILTLTLAFIRSKFTKPNDSDDEFEMKLKRITVTLSFITALLPFVLVYFDGYNFSNYNQQIGTLFELYSIMVVGHYLYNKEMYTSLKDVAYAMKKDNSSWKEDLAIIRVAILLGVYIAFPIFVEYVLT